MSIETQPLTLAAGESREVDFTGEYFELRTAVYGIDLIELLDRSGGVRARLKDPLESDFCRPGRFEKIRVTNGATAQTVKFAFGSGDAGSRRSSGTTTVAGTVAVAGTVDVVDGGKARTKAGAMGIAGMQVTGAAGSAPAGGVWNPAGSGKNAIVRRLMASSGTAQICHLTPVLVADVVNIQNLRPMLIGSAWGGAIRLGFTTNKAPGTYASLGLAGSFNLPASIVSPIVFDEPLVIPPGNGLFVVGTGLASDLSIIMPVYEEAQ